MSRTGLPAPGHEPPYAVVRVIAKAGKRRNGSIISAARSFAKKADGSRPNPVGRTGMASERTATAHR